MIFVMLLFGGMYFVVFLVPNVLIRDRQIAADAVLSVAYDRVIRDITEGLYWAKVDTVGKEYLIDPSKSAGNIPFLLSVDLQGGEGNFSSPMILNLNLEDSEQITEAAFSNGGRIGVIGSSKGTVFWRTDLVEEWSIKSLNNDIKLGSVTVAALSSNGQVGVIGDNYGAIYLTRNSGGSWTKVDPDIEDSEWITAAAFGNNGQIGVIGSNKGSLFWITDGDQDWSKILGGGDIELRRITAAALNSDGRTGMIGDNSGTVVSLTRKSDEERWTWTKIDLDLKDSEGIAAAAFGNHDQIGVIGDKGTVSLYQNEIWNLAAGFDLESAEHRIVSDMLLDEEGHFQIIFRENMVTGELGENGEIDVFGDTSGQVFLTPDGGTEWQGAGVTFKEFERMQAAAFRKELGLGIVVGSEGSVFVARNLGAVGNNWKDISWESTTGELSQIETEEWIDGVKTLYFYSYEELSSSPQSDYYAVIAETEPEASHYVLVKFPDLEEEMSLIQLYLRIVDDPLMRNAEIIDKIGQDIEYRSEGERVSPGSYLSGGEMYVLVTRLIVVSILLFLAQNFVRIAQYNLRLAAFWDSRANALILFGAFADRRSETFDHLVKSLAPDGYDFKSTRRMPDLDLPKRNQ